MPRLGDGDAGDHGEASLPDAIYSIRPGHDAHIDEGAELVEFAQADLTPGINTVDLEPGARREVAALTATGAGRSSLPEPVQKEHDAP